MSLSTIFRTWKTEVSQNFADIRREHAEKADHDRRQHTLKTALDTIANDPEAVALFRHPDALRQPDIPDTPPPNPTDQHPDESAYIGDTINPFRRTP